MNRVSADQPIDSNVQNSATMPVLSLRPMSGSVAESLTNCKCELLQHAKCDSNDDQAAED